MQDQAHWSQDTKKTHLLQTHVASMQSATWLFESEGVSVVSLTTAQQFCLQIKYTRSSGQLCIHYPTDWTAHLGKPSVNGCGVWFSAIKALLFWWMILVFLLTCVLRHTGTQNWNILNLIRWHMLTPDSSQSRNHLLIFSKLILAQQDT